MTEKDQTTRLRAEPPPPDEAPAAAPPKTPALVAPRTPARAVSPRPVPALETAAPRPPTPAAPRYRILGSIHRGGMGEILLAKLAGPEGFERKVVLKGLLERLTADDVSFQLFMREACLMARLDHPNVVRVFDLPTIHQKPYLAMEYIRGRNFHQVIQRAGAAHPGMPVKIALHVVAEALRGLHSAHNAKDEKGELLGIIHRDVSPGNILVSFFGEVKVTDFGIAKVANSPKFTGPRSIRGKARYVAPEQVHGQPASVASDIYSAGVVLAEALLGEALWERATVPETLLAIVSEDRAKVVDRVLADRPQVPGVRSVLLRALAMKPEERFVSALQFAETLEAIQRSLGAPLSHVELGSYLRRLFADAPDLPADDGFGASELPEPEVELEVPNTDPTIITLEPEWMRQESLATANMRPAAVLAPGLTPVLAMDELPLETRKVAPIDPHEVSDPVSLRGLLPEPAVGPGPAERAVRTGTRIRASALPVEAAVVQEPESVAEYSFSELILPVETEEEASREIEAVRDTRRALVRRPPSGADHRPRVAPGGLTMLFAGIFIGASLAIAGGVVALLLAR